MPPAGISLDKRSICDYTSPVKKRYITLLAAALVLPLNAQETAGASPAELTAAEQGEYAKQKPLCIGTLNLMKETIAVLKPVKDKATADAAAPRLKAIKARMDELDAKVAALGRPSKAVENKIGNELEPQLMQLMNDVETVVTQLELNGFYGSDALKALFSQGSAPMP